MMIKKKGVVGPATLLLFYHVLLVWPSTVFFLGSAQNDIETNISNNDNKNGSIGVNVGVVLDLETTFGKMGLSYINMAVSDFYASNPHYNTRLILHTRDSKSDVVGAAAAALDLLKNVKVNAIIGPKTSMQTNFIVDLGDKAQVPVITFSAKSPSLASSRSSYFFRAATNDSAQVDAIVAIVKAFGWRQVVPIYVDNDYGRGVIPYLTDALQAINVRIPYRSVIPPVATDDYIAAELYKLMTMPTRVFVVHMLPELGDRIFTKANEIGMMSQGYVWIVTDGITDLLITVNSSVLDLMQGVLGVKAYVSKTKLLQDFMVRWKIASPSIPLVVYGLWAYDAIFALAMAVEKIANTSNFDFKKSNFSVNSTDLDLLEVSQDGPRLVEALSRTKFQGISGDFSFVNGQLQTLNFEIINVNGSGERRLGFWTLKNGLLRKLGNSRDRTTYSASNTSLGPMIWPGDLTSTPKGWQIPTYRKRLKIGVPVKQGFKEFVNVSFPFSNDTVTGYSIDVLKAVLGVLPYSVSFEFIPLRMPKEILLALMMISSTTCLLGNLMRQLGT